MTDWDEAPIHDLDQVEWWGTDEPEWVMRFERVRVGENTDRDYAILPADVLRHVLTHGGYRFRSGAVGQWLNFGLEQHDGARAFVRAAGLDLYGQIITAGHEADRANDVEPHEGDVS